ncbi:hypothetical protein V8G54_004162 [Vigna mungo]|uniref:Trichome birefringence-like C-terminal domain-containing protein n=1 Tax=Vigna mungo TaxID=3915 RepID=A0AAQ3PC65_VIGMU
MLLSLKRSAAAATGKIPMPEVGFMLMRSYWALGPFSELTEPTSLMDRNTVARPRFSFSANFGLTAGLTTENCYGETAPIMSTNSTYPGVYPEQIMVVDMVIREMSNPAYLLDITMLSVFRKDAHPSIYSGDLNPQQRAKPDYSADCSH